MVTIDAGFLGLMLHPRAKPPMDPETKQPIVQLAGRLEKLEEDWHASNERVIIPTPALAEFLVLAGADGPELLQELNFRSHFRIRDFDQLAAIELASMEINARKAGSKRSPASEDAPWQKIKVDRQIVAIAKVNQARTIYSDDLEIRKIAEEIGIRVIPCWELEIPISKTPLWAGDANPINLK